MEGLLESISVERLAPYRKDVESEDSLVPYARYFWNTALCESLYPTLNALEITLRNSLHGAVSDYKGTIEWFEEVLVSQDLPALEEIRKRLVEHNIPQVAGQIVANSDFGFWARLLNARYEGVLWPALLRNAFPHMPNSIMTRKTLSIRMNRVRYISNRVFRYEPIWNDLHIAQKHNEINEIKEAIGWMSPGMLKAVEIFDRFPEVFNQGFGHYQTLLSNSLDT